MIPLKVSSTDPSLKVVLPTLFTSLFVFSLSLVSAATCPTEGDDVTITSDCSLPPGTYLYGNLTVKDGAEMSPASNTWVYVINKMEVKSGSKVKGGNFCVGCTYSETSWIEKIEPSYYSPVKGKNHTNQLQFTVHYNATDISEVDYFQLQYRVENRTQLVQDWTDWKDSSETSETFGPNSPVKIKNGLTYYFRIREHRTTGRIGKWSEEASVTVDTEKPICSLHPLPSEVTANFQLSWEADDFHGSGLKSVEVQYSTDSGWNNIDEFCNYSGSNADCLGQSGTNYKFRCRATDYATNLGDFSEIVATRTTDIVASYLEPLPEWIGEAHKIWRNGGFQVEWKGTYQGVETECYYVKWKEFDPDSSVDSINPDQWNDLTREGDTCLSTEDKKEIFGDDETNLTDGKAYYFIIRSKNIAGQSETWPDPPDPEDSQRITHTVVDRIPPEVSTEVRDQDGNIIEDWEIPNGTEKVEITARDMDSISGVKNHIIDMYITDEVVKHETKDCGSAEPGTETSCTYSLELGPSTQVRYRAQALDNAGNINWSTGEEGKWHYLIQHPIANFVSHSLFLALGSIYWGKVQVRNLRPDRAVNITLELAGYDNIKFTSGPLQARAGYTISENGKKLQVYHLNPFEERTYPVEIMSSQPKEYTLEMYAEDHLGLNDQDQMKIVVGFPLAFSGLTGWAVILLISISSLLYYIKRGDSK